MLNPLLPAFGIWSSGVVIGYIDVVVWTSFFGVTALIAVSYFLAIIPRKYNEKLRHLSFKRSSLL